MILPSGCTSALHHPAFLALVVTVVAVHLGGDVQNTVETPGSVRFCRPTRRCCRRASFRWCDRLGLMPAVPVDGDDAGRGRARANSKAASWELRHTSRSSESAASEKLLSASRPLRRTPVRVDAQTTGAGEGASRAPCSNAAVAGVTQHQRSLPTRSTLAARGVTPLIDDGDLSQRSAIAQVGSSVPQHPPIRRERDEVTARRVPSMSWSIAPAAA